MDQNNAGPNHPPRVPSILFSASDDSEEEIDREIIESLTRAHPTNAEVNVDEMIALQQQESTNENLQPAPMAASTSLAKSPKRPNQDLLTDDDMADVVGMTALSEMQQQESTNENLQPAPMAASTSLAKSPKRPKQVLLTDDDMADVVGMIALNEMQQQESTNDNLQPGPMAASTSLAKSPKRPKQDLLTDDDMEDVVGMIALNEMQQQESANDNLQPALMAASTSLAESPKPAPMAASTSLAESPKRPKQDLLTDDDMADMEVSQLTSSFESRNRPGTSSTVLKKPIATFPSSQFRRCQSNKENPIVPPPFNNDPFVLQIPVFPPLRELNFDFDSDAAMNSSTDHLSASTDRLSANGLEKRRSRDSSGSPDERQILVWRIDGTRIRSEEIRQSEVLTKFVKKIEADNAAAAAKAAENADDPAASTSGNSKKPSAKEKKNKKKQ